MYNINWWWYVYIYTYICVYIFVFHKNMFCAVLNVLYSSLFDREKPLWFSNITVAKRERASLVAWRVKSLPAMQETWVWFLSWEGPLEKEIVTHSSVLAWKIAWTEEPGGLQSMGSQRVGHNWATNTLTLTKGERVAKTYWQLDYDSLTEMYILYIF